MKTKIIAPWKPIIIVTLAFLMLMILGVVFSSTISNTPHQFAENPVCYHSAVAFR
jgi:hypothetical protein